MSNGFYKGGMKTTTTSAPKQNIVTNTASNNMVNNYKAVLNPYSNNSKSPFGYTTYEASFRNQVSAGLRNAYSNNPEKK